MFNFKEKVIKVEDAVKLVENGYNVATGLGASEAQDFMANLHLALDGGVEDLRVTNYLPQKIYPFMDVEYKGKVFVDSMFYTGVSRKLEEQGMGYFVPNNLSLSGVDRLRHRKPNIYVGAASKVDEHGYMSLSTSNVYERRMIDAADIVILEANPNYPRTFGDVLMHVSEVDYIIESNYEPPVLPSSEPNEKDMIIGKLIADVIEDGDCIQLGIGGIPNAVAKFLYDKKDLGVHTEMLTSEIANLSEAGVINGSKKTLHKGKIVTAFILGDKKLYEFADNNPAVEVYDARYTNDPFVIGKNDNQVSINTAIEVDLTGQVSSESIGSRQFSGTGGQADTARGAMLAENGRSIIALYSTAMIRDKATGERVEKSKIVSRLTPGAYVTLQRQDVDMVVTEYGIAKLKGKNVGERIESLIEIAHPDFRDELRENAKEYGLLK